MMQQLRKTRGQGTLEIAVTFAVVGAVVLAMAVYYKRAGMGRLKGAADQLGSQFSIEGATGTSGSTYNSTTTEATLANGTSTTTITTAVQNQTETMTIGRTDTETLFK